MSINAEGLFKMRGLKFALKFNSYLISNMPYIRRIHLDIVSVLLYREFPFTSTHTFIKNK